MFPGYTQTPASSSKVRTFNSACVQRRRALDVEQVHTAVLTASAATRVHHETALSTHPQGFVGGTTAQRQAAVACRVHPFRPWYAPDLENSAKMRRLLALNDSDLSDVQSALCNQ